MASSSRRRPKKSLGQNFLVDPNLQRKIVEAVDASTDDVVLEIGPGRGALTRHLEGTVRRLILVELDDHLAAELEARYRGRDDVRVVHADVLETSLDDLVEDPGSLKVVGNIPYNITTPIIFHLLERPRPREALLMVQKEVGRRIVAEAGTGAYGALAVGVQTVARAEWLFGVGRGAFRPVPRVDSGIVRITPRTPPPLSVEEEESVRTLVRAAFQWRRKQLRRILRDHPDLGVPAADLPAVAEAVGIDLEDRPERLTPDDFVRLAARLA